MSMGNKIYIVTFITLLGLAVYSVAQLNHAINLDAERIRQERTQQYEPAYTGSDLCAIVDCPEDESRTPELNVTTGI